MTDVHYIEEFMQAMRKKLTDPEAALDMGLSESDEWVLGSFAEIANHALFSYVKYREMTDSQPKIGPKAFSPVTGGKGV